MNVPDISKTIEIPVEGMIVHDLDDECLKLYDGEQWKCVSKYCKQELDEN